MRVALRAGHARALTVLGCCAHAEQCPPGLSRPQRDVLAIRRYGHVHADGHRFKSFAIATLFLVCRRFGQAVRLPASSSAGAACFCAGQRAITPRHAVILCPDGRAGRPRSQQQEMPTVGLEPTTTRLRATRPTSWARRASGRRRGKGGGQLHASPTHGAWPARPSCCARSTIARLPRGPNTIGRRRGWATLFMGASQRHGSKWLCAAKPKACSSCAAAPPPPR